MNVSKNELMPPSVQAIPNTTGQTALGTDACDKQVQCKFLQKQKDDGTQHIIDGSRTINDVEKRYDTTQKIACDSFVCTDTTLLHKRNSVYI